jgi:Pep3/Vps18/deep orange family
MFSDVDRRTPSSRGVGRTKFGLNPKENNHPTDTSSGEPSIWAARHVEWHLDALSLANYQKLLKQSREAGTALGIEEKNSSSNANKDANAAATTTEEGDGEAGGGGGESSYFSGFMSRVLNPASANDSMSKDDDAPTSSSSAASGSRPLRPPRAGCVATANSWMVAAVECPSGDSASSVLRLVSRWNVRRMSGIDQWMVLPPPAAGGDGRVMHVFVDPTGTHTLISARNGEAYYHHSSLRTVQKLNGFGRNADGSWSKDLNGISATSQARMSSNAKPLQMGISAGSYVTAVAWDREKGTEGTSRKILLGTSAGEIYEYMLASGSSATTTNVTSSGASSSSTPKKNSDTEEILTQPVLLHQLQSEAPVTGLIFERLRTGLLVLCSTSGKNKRTRFYTFYSAHSSSFRMVLADEAHASLVELPGSLDHADLRICNDHIVMRTETGIYYGTIDRAQSGPAFAGGSMIVDSGILPYPEKQGIPVSVALTPHHIITLSENNEVRFINRVAQKVIQKERVEFTSGSTSDRASTLHMDESIMGIGELMSDIRRPDQVWLRKARSLVHISSTQEDRDVWKYTLFKSLEMPSSLHTSSTAEAGVGTSTTTLSEEEKAQENMFEQAKTLCTNPSQKAVVTAVRAEYHLSQGRATLAAKYLAQCPPALEPFADTAVRLALTNLGIDDPHSYGGSSLAKNALQSNMPLITYLSDKMRVAKNNNDKMTCTMIGAWLTELYLHEKDSSPTAKQALTQFLSQNVHTMDAKTIMKILTSHDVNATDCAAYAAVSGDISTAVAAALRVSPDTQDGVVEALRILNEAPFELAESLYYKYASTLLARAPVLGGKSFLSRYTHGLSPTRLLPSFMFYERLRRDRVRAKQVAQAAKGKNPFAKEGVEESKTLESVDVMGSRDMFGGGVEVQILTQAGSFVDDPSVSIKYLEGVIKLGCRSSAIYSFLISLYVEMADEEPLYKFLLTHVPSASLVSDASRKAGLHSHTDDGLSGPLDMSYALRTILGTGRHFRSAIKLYM